MDLRETPTEETKTLDLGKATLLNGYCIKFEFDTPINSHQIRETEIILSKALGYPVVLISQINSHCWHMLHTDAVFFAKNKGGHDLNRLPLLDVLSMDYDWDILILGLWDGTNIDELYNLLQQVAVDSGIHEYVFFSYYHIHALQSRTLTEKECKTHRLGVKSNTLCTYYLDHAGNGLILPRSNDFAEVVGTGKRIYFSRECFYRTKGLNAFYPFLYMLCKPTPNAKSAFQFSISQELLNCVWELKIDDRLEIECNPNPNRCSHTELSQQQERTFYRAFLARSYHVAEKLSSTGVTTVEMHRLILNAINEELLKETASHIGYPTGLELTLEGRSRAMKKLSPRLKRKTVDALLETMLTRADELKHLDYLHHKVERIVVFGSYLNKEAKSFGDLDCVIEFSKKNTSPNEIDDLWNKAIDTYNSAYDAFEKGIVSYRPPTPDYMNFYFYCEILASKHIKQSNHALSCHHDKHELLNLDQVREVLVVYENGKRVTPYRISPSTLYAMEN